MSASEGPERTAASGGAVRILLVLVGGGLGTILRWSLEAAFGAAPGTVPWMTFAINLSGSFILGALLAALAFAGPDSGWRQAARLGVGTGVLGGFTTYSTFVVEAVRIAGVGQVGLALGYAVGSVAAGIACAAAGGWIVHRLAGGRR